MQNSLGTEENRRDGRAKVTGRALYTAEIALPELVHAVLVCRTIAHGRVVEISSEQASVLPGVLAVITHWNFDRLHPVRVMLDPGQDGNMNASGAGQQLLPLQDDRVFYRGQPIAAVVAETLEQAQYAASILTVRYETASHKVNPKSHLADSFSPGKSWTNPADVSRGDLALGLKQCSSQIDATYVTAFQHHVAMEPHATVANWNGSKLTVYEPSTWVVGVRKTLAAWFAMPQEDIHVLQYFVGGSFGSKGPTWPHVAIAAGAAKLVRRPVKLVITRPQTFTANGYRPQIVHRVQLAAKSDGALTAIGHHATAVTSAFDNRVVAPATKTTRKLYACPNCSTTYRLVNLNLPGPFTMRGPGETPGLFALECAMDELAFALKMDPIELRLKNDTPIDPETGKPWSSRSLRQCLVEGAARFGWSRRSPQPRSMERDGRLIGMGVAAMAYDAKDAEAKAKATVFPDGSVVVESSTTEQGTGASTIFCQIAADTLQLPASTIQFRFGDTALPGAPIAAGSQTTASVGSAIKAACEALRDKMAESTQRPLFTEATFSTTEEHKKHTCYSFGAHFAEVSVDPSIGHVEVVRYVCCFGAGKIVNPKTARSQLLGGVIWGIGMALMEGTHLDSREGAFVNNNLAEYHVLTNLDVPGIDAFFLPENDDVVNPLGVKGIGEIGTIGSAAAIANAVFHATGKRIRELPITPDKLLLEL